jgi:hypothetical protein
MKRVLKKIFLPCTIATEMIEKDIYFKLSAFEKLRLFLHTGLCGMCHRYRKHSRLLHRLLTELHHEHEQEHPPTPKEEDLTALKEKITNRLGNN